MSTRTAAVEFRGMHVDFAVVEGLQTSWAMERGTHALPTQAGQVSQAGISWDHAIYRVAAVT